MPKSDKNIEDIQDTNRSADTLKLLTRMIKLPFHVDLDAPFSKVIYKNPQEAFKQKKEVIIVAQRILKPKLKSIFLTIKKHASLKVKASTIVKVPSSLSINRYTKNQIRTELLNLKVYHMRKQAFYVMKQSYLSIKNYQLLSNVENKQDKLIDYLVSKIEEKLKIFAFRKLVKIFKEDSGKYSLVKALHKTSNIIINRAFYSQFILRLKTIKDRHKREEIIFTKLGLILSKNSILSLQIGFRKVENFTKWQRLEKIIQDKKKKIAKIYDLNSERTTTLQQQRQKLRALKYKLDHEAVQKSHVLTQKRREQILAKSNFNQETKRLALEATVLESQLYRLEDTRNKQKWISQCLEMVTRGIRLAKQFTHHNSSQPFYQGLVKRLYMNLQNLLDSDVQIKLEQVKQLVRLTESRALIPENVKPDSILTMRTFLSNPTNQMLFDCEQASFYQLIIKQYESRRNKPNKNLSKMSSPVSLLRMSKSDKSLGQSQTRSRITPVVNSPAKNRTQTVQMMRIREENSLQKQIVQIILRRQYDEYSTCHQNKLKQQRQEEQDDLESVQPIHQMQDI